MARGSETRCPPRSGAAVLPPVPFPALPLQLAERCWATPAPPGPHPTHHGSGALEQTRNVSGQHRDRSSSPRATLYTVGGGAFSSLDCAHWLGVRSAADHWVTEMSVTILRQLLADS